jgi:lactate 2-monooxygenase
MRVELRIEDTEMRYFGEYQNEIYFGGLQGIVPKLPVNFNLLEQQAVAALPLSVVSYVMGGCGDEFTQRQNVEAFNHWGLVPRMMVDCSTRDLSIDLFGLKLTTPIFLSPIGVLGLCTEDGHGDLATARAAAKIGVPMIASTLSNDPLETVAEAFGETPGFFQLYTSKDMAVAESMVHRAEAAGYKGIVITLDTWLTGWRPRDLNDANFPCSVATFSRTTSRIPASARRWPNRPKRTSGPPFSNGLGASARCSLGRTSLAPLAHESAPDPERNLSS